MRPLCPIGHLALHTDSHPVEGGEIVDCINSQLASIKLLDS